MQTEHHQAFLDTMRKIPLFNHLDPEECNGLCTIAQQREYEADQTVFDEGARTPGLFLIQSGRVEINKKMHNGEKKMLATLEPPSFFGEMSFVSDQATSAGASAKASTICYVLDRDAFSRMLEANDLGAYKAMAAIARILSKRLLAMDEMVIQLLADQPEKKQEHFAQFKSRFFTEFNY